MLLGSTFSVSMVQIINFKNHRTFLQVQRHQNATKTLLCHHDLIYYKKCDITLEVITWELQNILNELLKYSSIGRVSSENGAVASGLQVIVIWNVTQNVHIIFNLDFEISIKWHQHRHGIFRATSESNKICYLAIPVPAI